MQYFTDDYLQFFKDLATNNNKEWFHSQKKRYEESVKKPFAKFTEDLIKEVGVNILPKDAISRINRDIRFAKDKTPYNLQLNAIVSQFGKKDKSYPGVYVRLGPEMLGIMGGCYGLEKEQLTAVRDTLVNDGDSLNKLLETKNFKEKFGAIRGDQMKRVPKEYQSAVEKNPLVLNKQFYYVAELDPKTIISDQLMPTILEYYKAMQPVNEYLIKASGRK
jgi:uncharacterized protein (TIGR02453 family)